MLAKIQRKTIHYKKSINLNKKIKMNFKIILLLALSLLVIEGSFAQTKRQKKITISGYVTDGNDKPLSGVTIIVDGVTLNKSTNSKGFYNIKVKPDIKSLMVYTLYNGGLEVEFKGKTKINFILEPNTSNEGKYIPKDQLVDLGYGNALKSNLASSYGVIDGGQSDDFTYKNIFDMIQGQVPGVVVSGSSITIRGTNSINSGTQPLFVVDGSTTDAIDYINPRDVKSISIIKGSATAIYGVRGANGVILITTKSGSIKK